MALLFASFRFSLWHCFLDAPVLAIHEDLRLLMLALLDQLQNTLPAALHSCIDEIVPRADGLTGKSQPRGLLL